VRTTIGCLLACLLTVVVLAGCGAKNPPQIIVMNNTPSSLTNIVLRGNGFTQIISRIEQNESTNVTVLPDGESSVTMEVATPFRQITASDVGYFERDGGYRVRITITEDYNVETKVDLKAMP
jgi:hypothetical protein